MDATEHRIPPRQRVLKAGTIAFGDAGISCTVSNLSEAGACLEVISPVGIPECFTLVIDAGRCSRSCQIVRRKEKRIGITFA